MTPLIQELVRSAGINPKLVMPDPSAVPEVIAPQGSTPAPENAVPSDIADLLKSASNPQPNMGNE